MRRNPLATSLIPLFMIVSHFSANAGPASVDPDITVAGSDDDALRSEAATLRSADPRPNILLIFTDQQTISGMSCAGNKWVNTPNMDALARAGVRFLTSYCAAPICGPSRGSIVTGLPPHANGVIYNGDPLEKNIPTLGSVLRDGGYYTAWTGKWHLPESFLRDSKDAWGFHHRALPKEIPEVALGDQTDFITATDAEYFLRWQVGKQSKPWFLGVSLHNPHDICYHVREDRLEYANKDAFPPLPSNFATDLDEPEALKLRRQNKAYGHELAETKDWDADRWRAYLFTYYHLITQVDRAVGQVLKALEAGGWNDNTLVIFTSDHGEGIAAHRWATKLSLYDESACVPLIVSYPGRIQPGTAAGPVSAFDLMPTICDYAGARVPPGLPGNSLRPALEGNKDGADRHVVCELAADKDRPEIQGRMVRTRRYKYCAFAPGGGERMFDMQEDPGETRNLAPDKDHAEELHRHRELLADWCRKTGDPFQARSE